MRSRLSLLTLLAMAAVVAVPAAARAQSVKALTGTWTLDQAKSTFKPGPAPSQMTITYAPDGDAMKIVVDLTPATGPAQHWETSVKYGGPDAPVTGNPNADSISTKLIDDRRGVSTQKKDGKVVSTNTRTLSADGKTLTIVSKGTTADGKPRSDVQVFHK